MRASYSVMMSWFGTPKACLKWSTMVDTRGRHMMRLATNAGSGMPSAVRWPSPPQVTPVVACHQEWTSRSTLSEALSVNSDQEILVQQVPVDAHVMHKLGDISVFPGEDHLGGGVVNAANRRAHLVPGSH